MITGIWAIVSITSFSTFTQHQGDYFLKHANAVLFLMLGILFVWHGIKRNGLLSIVLPAISVSLGIVLVELFYLPRIGNPLPFWLDFFVEFILVILLTFLLLIRERSNSQQVQQ